MKIKKLSKKLDFDVEAQARPCNRDCPSSIIYVHNKSVFERLTSMPRHCTPVIVYSSFISKMY